MTDKQAKLIAELLEITMDNYDLLPVKKQAKVLKTLLKLTKPEPLPKPKLENTKRIELQVVEEKKYYVAYIPENLVEYVKNLPIKLEFRTGVFTHELVSNIWILKRYKGGSK